MNNQYDVVVVGGGIAGVSAAISAARMGASTLLIEKNMMLGGVLTQALVMPMMTFHSQKRKTISGIGQEIVNRLINVKGSPGHINDPIGFVKTVTPFQPEKMKTVLLKMVKEAGVDLLLGMTCSDVKVEDSYVKEIQLCNEYGELKISSKTFIDATGSGNLAIRSGSPYVEGDGNRHNCQPMTLALHLGDIDKEIIIKYIRNNPSDFVVDEKTDHNYLAVAGFFEQMKNIDRYDVKLKRDRLLFFELPFSDNQIIMNTTRYSGYAGDPQELTEAQYLASTDIWNFMDFLRKEIPGFSNAELVQTGSSIGIRETTHVKTEKIITISDLTSKTTYSDSIAVGSYPVDIHLPSNGELKTITLPYPGEYQIPFSSLLPQKIENVLLAGRALGADHLAFSAVRTSPLATATGMASGIAAAYSVESGIPVKLLNNNIIRDIIIEAGGIVE
ncbi:MAG: FAD-dependent oxidoreductase [Kosmotogaceae bacterium]